MAEIRFSPMHDAFEHIGAFSDWLGQGVFVQIGTDEEINSDDIESVRRTLIENEQIPYLIKFLQTYLESDKKNAYSVIRSDA